MATADLVFEPLLAPDGALASTVGTVVGTGPGRGIALLLTLAGGLMLLSAVAVTRSPDIAALELDVAPSSPMSTRLSPTSRPPPTRRFCHADPDAPR